MPKASNRAFTVFLVLWMPVHFAAQITQPLEAAARKLGAPERLETESRRRLEGPSHPAVGAYLGLFGVVQAYGFFADVRTHGVRFRVAPTGLASEVHSFPPESWRPFDYDHFQLRLFEALAFDDALARTYLGNLACALWPGATNVRIERLNATRSPEGSESGALRYERSETLSHSCSR